MDKELLLFDWDDTLFSKNEFVKNLSKNLAGDYGVTDREILNLEEKYVGELEKPGDFRIDGFLKYLEQKFNKKVELEDFLTDKLGIYSRSLFNDTTSVLNELKNYFRLGIYSQGFEDIQKTKIKSSGLEDFFDEQSVYIDRDKLNPDFVAKLPTGATIIDDKTKVIEKLKTLGRFNIIWINRKNEEQIEGVKTIKNLRELSSVVDF